MKETTPKTSRRRAPKTNAPVRFAGYETVAVAALEAALEGGATAAERVAFVRLVRRYVAAYGLLPTAHAEYHDTIERIAKLLNGKRLVEAERDLDRIDDELQRARGGRTKGPDLLWASDAAVDRWTPNVTAGMLFGIALGAAFVSNGEDGR